MLGFAAALARGLATLLPPNPLPETINVIHRKWPGSQVLGDRPVALADAPIVALDLSRTGPPDNVVVAASALAAVAFTSGSTGEPEPQPKSWRALVDGTAINLGHYLAEELARIPSWRPCPRSTCRARDDGTRRSARARDTPRRAAVLPADVAAALFEAPAPRVLVSTPVHLRALLRRAALSAAGARALRDGTPGRRSCRRPRGIVRRGAHRDLRLHRGGQHGIAADRGGRTLAILRRTEARWTLRPGSAPHLPSPVPPRRARVREDGGFLLAGRTATWSRSAASARRSLR